MRYEGRHLFFAVVLNTVTPTTSGVPASTVRGAQHSSDFAARSGYADAYSRPAATGENFGTIFIDEGQPESSGWGGVVFALSDGSNPVTFVIKAKELG